MGILFGTTVDINSPTFALLTDDAAIAAQAIELILSTPNGSLWSSPESGDDLASYVGRGLTPAQLAAIPRQIENAITTDPRFARADVTAKATYTGGGAAALKLAIVVYPKGAEDIPIPLVGTASAELVQIITRGL
jgi:phage baseplate assembly protein W